MKADALCNEIKYLYLQFNLFYQYQGFDFANKPQIKYIIVLWKAIRLPNVQPHSTFIYSFHLGMVQISMHTTCFFPVNTAGNQFISGSSHQLTCMQTAYRKIAFQNIIRGI